jgi:tetratricopeptide (TPR) repeat protein
MKSFKSVEIVLGLGAACIVAALLSLPTRAQGSTRVPPPPPPPPAAGESSSKNPPPTSDTAAPPTVAPDRNGDEPPAPTLDVLAAQKNVEIGSFYLKRGDYEAAIDRFKDATQNQPKFAEPWRLLGEAYEKKKDLPEAIDSYQHYLLLYPHAPNRKKLEDHIAELQNKMQKEPQKQTGK